jgi:hypothetical protein
MTGLSEFEHGVVDHAVKYVDGKIHTNGLENFWSLLKRGLHGTYVSVEPFHLFRYLDEQTFRYNNRKHDAGELLTDADRFDFVVRQIVGKRLTFDQLTGKIPAAAHDGPGSGGGVSRKPLPPVASSRQHAVGAARQRGARGLQRVEGRPAEAGGEGSARAAPGSARKRKKSPLVR